MRRRAGRSTRASIPVAVPLAVAATLLTAACGGEAAAPAGGTSAGGEYVAERTTGEGGDTVRITSGSRWGAEGTLVEELAIGEETGEDPYLFGAIAAAWATDERIYVVDLQVPAVRAFDHQGQFLFQVGRTGQGPGEYSRPMAMAVADDGRVLVSDVMGARLNVYDSEGEAVEDWPLGSPQAAVGVELTDDGDVYTRTVELPESMEDFRGDLRMGMQPVGPGGPTGEAVFPPEIDYEPPTVTIPIMGREMEMPIVPFAPGKQWAFAPGGEFVVGVGTDYRFEIHRPDGSTTVVEKYWDPVPVEAAEADFRARLAARPIRNMAPDFEIDEDVIPETKPAFTSFHADRSGRVWVAREGSARPDPDCSLASGAAALTLMAGSMGGGANVVMGGGDVAFEDEFPDGCWISPPIFDVFELSSGDFLGSVPAPEPGFRAPLFVDGDTVLASVVDEIGTVRLKAYRLAGGSRRP